MKAKVVGIKNLNFVTKEGSKIEGKKIQIVRFPSTREQDVEGQIVDTIFINANSDISLPVFKFGQDYEFNYETDGKHSYLVDVKSAV